MKRVTIITKHVLFFLLAVTGFCAITMLLWNALLPGIFGLTTINFWQAMGLLTLAKILFGSFGGHGSHHGMMHGLNSKRIREKWMKMTPDQRKEFAQKHHHGHFFGFHGKDSECRLDDTPSEQNTEK